MKLRWAIIALCFLGQSAWAGDLEKAVQLTDEMKYTKALKLVNKALKSPKSGPAELAVAFRVQGMCLAANGREKQAIAAFRKLLVMDPEYQMSKKVSPKMSIPFGKAKKENEGQKALTLAHKAPPAPEKLAGLKLSVELSGNPMLLVTRVRMVYRGEKGGWQQKVWKVKKPRELKMSLPARFKGKTLSYYFEALNRAGAALHRVGSSKESLKIVATAKEAPLVAAGPAKDGSKDGSKGSGSDEFKPEEDPKVSGDKDAGEGAGDGKLVAAAADAKLEGDQGEPGVDTGDEKPAVKDDDSGRWYTAWWFWTGVGVVVAGAVVGGSLAATAKDPADTTLYQVHLR